MITLHAPFFEAVATVDWFASVGRPWAGAAWTSAPVASAPEALASLSGEPWIDAKTQAQGALTSFLARHHRNDYGTRWNTLARDATARLDTGTRPVVQDRLRTLGWPEALLPAVLDTVLVDLTRAALEASYRAAFPKAPVFFGHLLAVYAAGHLPCGWLGDLDAWPQGRLLVY